MGAFEGFPGGKMRFTRIPGPFFSDLLPQIDDLIELKVTLYALWQLDRMEGETRYVQVEDFSEDEILMQGLGEDSVGALEAGLAAAVERGSLLGADVELSGATRRLYFLNSAKGREAVEAIGRGEWQASDEERYPIELNQERPNTFALYERHIGPLTPMISEALQDAEATYSPEWIEEAMRIAVENNVHKWTYIEAILKSWQKGGRDERRPERHTEKDRRKYVEGEFSDFIER